MQISRSSSDGIPFPRLLDEVPSGKRAIAIKWTDQEWAEIAASIYLMNPSLLDELGHAQLKARHVFEAQHSCLPRTRQRQLISIAQDFSTKRDKIVQMLRQMRDGTSSAGITLRPAFAPTQTLAEGPIEARTPATEVPDHADTVQTAKCDHATSEQIRPCTRNGLVILARSSTDTVTWSPEEWAMVARALLNDSVVVRDGIGDEGLDADSICAAQLVLPESRRRDLASIQARLLGDQARLRNILDVLRPKLSTPDPAAGRRPAGTVFRADGSGNGFTRFTPKSLSEAYPGHRVASADELALLSGVRRSGPTFKKPFPEIIDPPTVRRPEIEQAIAEVFGTTPEVPASEADASSMARAADRSGLAAVVTTSPEQKRSVIRWDDVEWRQVAQQLIEQAGDKATVDKLSFITPLGVHAAQTCLVEDRRRTVGSVYSGFASSREKLSEIVKEILAGEAISTPNLDSTATLASESVASVMPLARVESAAAPEICNRAAHDSERATATETAESVRSHSLDGNVAGSADLGSEIEATQTPDPLIEIARPFVRMLCEEICQAIARHFLWPVAVHSEEKNEIVC